MRPSDVARTPTVPTFRPGYGNRRLVRRGLLPAAIVAGALGTTALAGASPPPPVVTSAQIAGLGTVLVASHRPLYEMANDPRGHSSCTGACAKTWLPLIVSHRAAHHLGHVSGLGTIHRSDGRLQVALHGHALYFFAADHSTSHAGGQGYANNWFTVHTNGSLDRASTKSSGTIVTAPPSSSSGSSPSSSSSTTRPTSAPSHQAPNSPGSPAPTNPVQTTTAPTSPPTTAPPTTTPPPPTTTTTSPPTTTTTTSGGGGGVGF
jgi:predicted lipoprotein with Yx(FWY)xxD motif